MGDILREFQRHSRALHALKLVETRKINIEPWARNFRKAARSDRYSHFRSHLERLRQGESCVITRNTNLETTLSGEPEYYYFPTPLPRAPKSILENTIDIVTAVLAYAYNTNVDTRKFLAMQQYDASKAVGARYLFTFDLGKSVGRLFVDRRMRPLDLADLFGHPWPKLETVGYSKIWVSHPNWSTLTRAEFKFLESKITRDIRYDYGEDELELWFEPSEDASYLLVYFVEED
jgi:hypothetical protein